MKDPPHPGDFIRTEIIEPAGLSGDMALRVEKAFGVKMDTLMRMQASYEIAQTPKREKENPCAAISCARRCSCLSGRMPNVKSSPDKRRRNLARIVRTERD